MQRIFSIEGHPDQLNDFYNQVRCGLFHSGMTRNRVIINRERESLTIDFSEINVIKINYKKFYHKVRKDFEGYLKILKNQRDSAEKTNFNQMFSNLVNM